MGLFDKRVYAGGGSNPLMGTDPNQWNPMNPTGNNPTAPLPDGNDETGPDGSFNGPQWWRNEKKRGFLDKMFGQGGGDYHADTPAINQADYLTQLQAQINAGPGDAGQADLAAALQQQSLTGGPQAQIAQNNLRQATNQNIAQNTGMIASQKGINPALAARMAGQNAGNMNQQAAGQAENMKLASMLGAQNQLGDVLNQQRAGNNAYLQAISGGNANQNNAINEGKLGNQRINADIAMQKMKAKQGMMGGGMNALGSIGAAVIPALIGSGGGGGAEAGGAMGDVGISEGIGATAAHGGFIPGKPEVKGDSPKNDKIHALVSPGEIVIPRTAANDPQAAKKFIDELFKKNKKTGFKDVLSARRAKDAAGAKKYYDGGVTVGEDQSMADGSEDAYQPQMSWKDENAAPVEQPALVADEEIDDGDWRNGSKGTAAKETLAAQNTAYEDSLVKKEEQANADKVVDNPNLVAPEAAPTATVTPKQEDPFGAGYGKVVNGIMGEAKAAQAYGQKAEAAYNNLNTELAQAKQSFDKNYADLDAENRQIMADIKTQKIDPNHYWSSQSTAQKVSAGIGLMLSGIGSGLTGQPNLAAKMIDDGIARDIDAQKAELGKKETLLSANLRRYGNLKDAYAATTAQMTAVTQGQIAASAAKMGGDQAMSRANEMIGKLEMQRQAQLGSLAKAQMKGQQMSVAAAEAAFPGQYVKLPNGNAMVAQSKEEAAKLRTALQTQKEFHAVLNDAEKFMKDEAGVLGTMPTSARNDVAKQYVTKMTFAIKNLEKLGVLSEGDKELADAMAFDPGSFFSSSNKMKLKGLRAHIDEKTDAALSTGLIGNYSPMKAAGGDIQ